ncbi:trace amine-associated receptor 6-like [Coregonus clupeaformis]|uniref:trace amine-associated receptor 6-like n=1 Tax=Coregonus clupeaformis TaxID=59861 RepID=UPI001E1C4E76|nr:trace amine-associated receptor 6-like [Coregonus clupeaformis]
MAFILDAAVTVFLNILVIISISHFKQLHTPTNLLILSLAVADFLVGLIVIPVTTVAIMEPCWDFGEYFCVFYFCITCLCSSLSVGSLVLISIDRYVAVCDPLLYHSKITITRMMYCISITWCCCIIYDAAVIKIFVNVQANKSERKAAKTLAIVVFNYLICWIPFLICGQNQVPENVSVVVNNPVSLTCEASGIPLPAITWLNDGNTAAQETAADTSTSTYWV